LIIFFILLIGAVIFGAYSMRPKPPTYDFAKVEKRDIIQEVSVTGRVKPAEDVSLAFQIGGRVASSYVKVGDAVSAGDVLVGLQKADLLANLQQANARVDAEMSRLKQLREGTRKEEIDVQKVRVANAEVSYNNVKNNLITVAEDAYTKADDVMRNKVDRFYTNPRTQSPQLLFSLNDLQSETSLENGRASIELMLATWKTENAGLQNDFFDPSTTISIKNHLATIRSFLDQAALALTAANTNASVTQTMIDGYKTDVSTARASINATLSSLEAAMDALSAAGLNIDLEKSALALKEAPTLPETITAQIAVVDQMEANARAIEADIQKTILRSPIDGVVTEQNAKVGEIVSPSAPIISIISKSKYQIEAFVPEADIAKISLGDTASVTLDAYGDAAVFFATVMSVDPAETIIEGVATYKMTFRFNEDDEKIKSGMTANIDIRTAKNDGVLALPQRVLIRKDKETFAQILESDGITVKEILVTTGLRGSDGYTEILSGLREGQSVVVPKNI
jgi:multidrug efflux pump subunit AcrA (membrane-fusion protein)